MQTKPHYTIPTSIWLVLVAVLLVAFAAVTLVARTTPYFAFDLNLARLLQSVQVPGFDALMKIVSWPGYPPQVYGFIAFILAVLWFGVGRWEAVSFAFATLGISLTGTAVKMWVDRPRPSPSLIHVGNPLLDGGRQSYPAGHVEVYIALLGFLLYLLWLRHPRKPWQTLLMAVMALMIVLVGPSRIYIGEHWASDVAGAYLFGLIWLLLAIRFYEWGKNRFWVKHKDAVPANPGTPPIESHA